MTDRPKYPRVYLPSHSIGSISRMGRSDLGADPGRGEGGVDTVEKKQ